MWIASQPLIQKALQATISLPMTSELLAQIKATLEDEKTRLERELGDFAKKDKTAAGHFTPTYPESGGTSDRKSIV